MTEFATRLVHGPKQDQDFYGAVAVPVYKATTYAYPEIGQPVKYDYGRSGNPTRCALEDQLARLEGAAGAFAFSSGMAAIHAALALLKAGDHLIVGKQIYGGTFRLLRQFFGRWGLTVTAVDTRDLAAVEAAIRPNTRAIYFEPVTNPLLEVTPIAPLAKLAHRHRLLTIVDNTFLSPYLAQPLRWGADLVVHSATKYLSGHNDLLGGVLVVADPQLAAAYENYALTTGDTLASFDSWLLLCSLKTLPVRMKQHTAGARALVERLKDLPAVTGVRYPGVGGMISFTLQSEAQVTRLLDHLQLITFAESLGGVESLITIPYYQTHADIPAEDRKRRGLTPCLLRLSVGLEDPNDLFADLRQALAAKGK